MKTSEVNQLNTLTHTKQQFSLHPEDNHRLANLCGQCDEHLRQIEQHFHVEIRNRGHGFSIVGKEADTHHASILLQSLYAETKNNKPLTPAAIHLGLQQAHKIAESTLPEEDLTIPSKHGLIKPRSPNQRSYLQHIQSLDINFGIGPAGTGKTFLAVASAVHALETHRVNRILLVRPAVEAGERLGFLPGDLAQKVDPYLRPLYDALYEMLGFEKVEKLLEKQIIEVAPLAYMRGRTLNDSFVILDESQNTTKEQMKMFLTRIGFGSRVVVTGDITQIDLPRHYQSGLKHAIQVLKPIKNIGFTFFTSQDVVRHPLVQNIIEAYEQHEDNNNNHDAA